MAARGKLAGCKCMKPCKCAPYKPQKPSPHAVLAFRLNEMEKEAKKIVLALSRAFSNESCGGFYQPTPSGLSTPWLSDYVTNLNSLCLQYNAVQWAVNKLEEE